MLPVPVDQGIGAIIFCIGKRRPREVPYAEELCSARSRRGHEDGADGEQHQQAHRDHQQGRVEAVRRSQAQDASTECRYQSAHRDAEDLLRGVLPRIQVG